MMFLPKIRPEFFHHIRGHIPPNLRGPNSRHIPKASLRLRMIAVGRNRRRHPRSKHFRIIELPLPRIRSRYHNTAHRVHRSPPKSTAAQLVTARILMQHERQHRARHKILNRIICVRSSIPFRVTVRALSIRRIAVARLPEPSHKSHKHKLRRIDQRPPHHLEFLSRRKRRDVVRILHRQKIWQGPKNPVLRSPLLSLVLETFLLFRAQLRMGRILLRRFRCGRLGRCVLSAACVVPCCPEV
jgi:hypothetical protein